MVSSAASDNFSIQGAGSVAPLPSPRCAEPRAAPRSSRHIASARVTHKQPQHTMSVVPATASTDAQSVTMEELGYKPSTPYNVYSTEGDRVPTCNGGDPPRIRRTILFASCKLLYAENPCKSCEVIPRVPQKQKL